MFCLFGLYCDYFSVFVVFMRLFIFKRVDFLFMVLFRYVFRTYLFAFGVFFFLGFSVKSLWNMVVMFFIKCFFLKFIFLIMMCMMVFFFVLNFTRSSRCSRIVSATFVVIVFNFGFGINFCGFKICVIFFNFDIIFGVVIVLLNWIVFDLFFLILFINVASLIVVVFAFRVVFAFFFFVNIVMCIVFFVLCGNCIVFLMIILFCFGFMLRCIVNFTFFANLVFAFVLI